MPLTARYYRNRTNRLARHLTKRFREQAPYATVGDRMCFEALARQFYASSDGDDINRALAAMETFCKDVEARGQKGNETAGEGTSREANQLGDRQSS